MESGSMEPGWIPTRNHLVLILNLNENHGNSKDFFDKLESFDFLWNEKKPFSNGNEVGIRHDHLGYESNEKKTVNGSADFQTLTLENKSEKALERDHGCTNQERESLRKQGNDLDKIKDLQDLSNGKNENLKNHLNLKMHYFIPKINQSAQQNQPNQIHFQCLDMLNEILFEIISLKTHYLSIIGLGYGGLYARYLVGLLNERGVFHLVTPAQFITIDTPHLGNVLIDGDSQVGGVNKNFNKSTSHFFSSLFSTFSISQNNAILQEMDSSLNFVSPSKNEPPLLLKLCESFFLNPLKMFQSRSLFSPVNIEQVNDPHLSTIDKARPSGEIKKNDSIKGKSISRKKSNRKTSYQTSSISRSEFPLDKLESQTSLPSLILDTRSMTKTVTEGPKEMVEEELLQTQVLSAKETQSLVRQKLEQLDWRRIAIVPGKHREINIHDTGFWNAKESQPVIDSIINLLYSPIDSQSNDATDDDQLFHAKRLDSLLPHISSSSLLSNLPQQQSKSTKPTKSKDYHLVVLIHGLDGFSSDMDFISTRLRERYGTRGLRVFSPTANHHKTYDGILNGATRILYQVILEIGRIRDSEGGNCCYFSVIGHSLGGLYGRCLVGLLHEEGLLPDILKPVNFITLATPHLGSREHSKILGDKVTSMVLGSFIGLTGSELMLADAGDTDADPFVVELSKERFTQPLSLFTRLITYSNVRYDVPVHYSTAAIRMTPFQAPVSSTLHEKDPSQIYPVIIFDSKSEPVREEVEIPKENFEERMLLNLTKKLDWKRYAVITDRPFLAHIDIIIKSELWNRHGYPIIAHLIDHFRHPSRLFRKQVDDKQERLDQNDSALQNDPCHINSEEKTKSVHLVIILHGANKTARDMLPLVEKLRDLYPRPTYKIIAPDYPTNLVAISKDKANTGEPADGEIEKIVRVWLVAWVQYQISHSTIGQISIIAQGLGAIYGLEFILEFFKTNPSGIKFGSFISIDCSFLKWKIPNHLERKDINACLSLFEHLVMYCCSIDSNCPVTSGLLIAEQDELLISNMGRYDGFWRIVLLDSHRKRWKSEDQFANSSLSSNITPSSVDESFSSIDSSAKNYQIVVDAVSRLKWKRFVILPPKSTNPGSFFYWNNENQNHVIAHITSFLY